MKRYVVSGVTCAYVTKFLMGGMSSAIRRVRSSGPRFPSSNSQFYREPQPSDLLQLCDSPFSPCPVSFRRSWPRYPPSADPEPLSVRDPPRQDPSREVVDHRVQVGAGPVEQADDGGVDVPHLVGSRRSKAHLRLPRVHAEPGTAPAELPHEIALLPSGPLCSVWWSAGETGLLTT